MFMFMKDSMSDKKNSTANLYILSRRSCFLAHVFIFNLFLLQNNIIFKHIIMFKLISIRLECNLI